MDISILCIVGKGVLMKNHHFRKKNKAFEVLTSQFTPYYLDGAYIITLGKPRIKKLYNADYRQIVGWGRVRRIHKGEKFDIVEIDFMDHYWRDVIVYDNHARRQISTLKQGQMCMMTGILKFATNEEGIKTTRIFANMLQGQYVPKMIDIKRNPIEVADDLTEEEIKNAETDYLNFLDEIGEKVDKD